MNHVLSIKAIQGALIEIRGQQVLLDTDVARIYGVETKRMNDAVRNNPENSRMGILSSLVLRNGIY